MNARKLIYAVILGVICVSETGYAASRASRVRSATAPAPEAVSGTSRNEFAPVPSDHPLASVWNDPEFARRLVGSYGFHSELEPKMTPEEQTYYREKIVPLLRDEPEKAIGELQSRIKPDTSAVFDYTLGTIYFQSGDLKNAMVHYEQALAKHPDFLRAQRNLALALVREGMYAEALKPLSRTIALGGGDGKIFGLLGFVYLNREQYVSAEGAYRQAAIFEPENIDFKLAIVKCQIALENYAPARHLIDELLEKYPDRENLWVLQGNLFVQTEQHTKAAANFELLRKMGKISTDQLLLLGDIYAAQNAPDLALSAYLESVGTDAGRDLTRSLRAAEILASRGAWKQARELVQQIRRSAGEIIAAEHELKLLKLEVRIAMAEGAGEQAIGILEAITERNPLDGEALLLAGDYYARNGQPEKAEFRYDAASKIAGFEADAFVKHAQLLVQVRKYVQATELLRNAQKIKPRDNVQRYLEKVEQIAQSGRS